MAVSNTPTLQEVQAAVLLPVASTSSTLLACFNAAIGLPPDGVWNSLLDFVGYVHETITVVPTAYTIPAAGYAGTTVIADLVATGGFFRDSTNPTWLYVQPNTGTSYNGSVTITADANPSTSARTHTIVWKLTASGTTASLALTQLGAAYYITLDPPDSFLSFDGDGYCDWSGCDEAIEVTTNDTAWEVIWYLNSKPSWINLSQESGVSGAYVDIILADNDTGSIRTTLITFANNGNDNTYTEVTIEQDSN